MPDFSLLDNQDQFGNQYYPADDKAVIIEKEIWDEIVRALLVAVQTDPSTAGNNDIQPEGDFAALILRAFAAGTADFAEFYDKDGTKVLSISSSGSIKIPTQEARHEIGLYGTISETGGGLAYITGNNIVSSDSAANTLVKHYGAGDPAQFMQMRYDRGIVFHTGIGAGDAVGTTYSDTVGARWQIGLTGHLLPWTHLTYDIGSPIRAIRDTYVYNRLYLNDTSWLYSDGADSVRTPDTFRADTAVGAGIAPTSTLHSGGSFAHKVALFAATDTLDINETVALCDTSTAGFTLTLPAASTCTDRLYRIKKKSTDLNTLTVDGNGAELIDGSATAEILFPMTSIDLVSDGTAWWIL